MDILRDRVCVFFYGLKRGLSVLIKGDGERWERTMMLPADVGWRRGSLESIGGAGLVRLREGWFTLHLTRDHVDPQGSYFYFLFPIIFC